MQPPGREFDGRRVTVMGLGRFGGGEAVTRWLVEQGADIVISDRDDASKLAEPLARIADLIEQGRVTLHLGEHNVSDFTTVDMVIANPAVPMPWDNRFLRSAQAAGVPITTEIRLLVERLPMQGCGKVIGVTGSAGKSTTAAMIHHLLQASGIASHLGGNIGGSLLPTLPHIKPDDWVVLELSSAMLHWLGEGAGYPQAKGWSPRAAVLTNITPNHIDWHGSFEHYRESKLNIFRHQAINCRDCVALRGDDLNPDESRIALSIPGEHNQRNARLAMETVQRATGMKFEELAPRLMGFAGLPHRLQLAGERDGLRFYNDSKSTTPEATLLAVASFDDPLRVHLIAGGYDKKIDLSAIARLTPGIAGLYTIGETGNTLAEAGCRSGGGFAAYCGTLDRAVETALARMRTGDVLLLSPGCASWDQFINFEQRGEQFTRLINRQPISAV